MTVTVQSAPITINFHRPPGTPLGVIMNEIRMWLDDRGIRPLDFKPVVGHAGIGFEICFRDQYEAEQFQRAF